MSFSSSANTGMLSVGTSSTSVALPIPAALSAWSNQVLVVNAGANPVFVAFGGSSVTAAIPVAGTPANGVPVPAGASQVFTVSGAVKIAAIAATGTNSVYFVAGVGSA